MATLKIRFTIRKVDDEYQVRKFENNRLCKGATYYTDDPGDAKATLLLMVANVTDNHVYRYIDRTSKNSVTVTLA